MRAASVASTVVGTCPSVRRLRPLEHQRYTYIFHLVLGFAGLGKSRRLDLAGTAALVGKVRASVARAMSAALEEIATALPAPVLSVSLRTWPFDFPEDIAVQRRAPYEARADAIMYRRELAELALARGWEVHLYDAKAVVDQAVRMLSERANEILQRPRATMGRPWTRDHRIALAATIVAD